MCVFEFNNSVQVSGGVDGARSATLSFQKACVWPELFVSSHESSDSGQSKDVLLGIPPLFLLLFVQTPIHSFIHCFIHSFI